MAAAIGEKISVFAPNGVMVVDIGGGTTEIAVISLGGIVVSRSLRLAGEEMNQAIIHYVRLRHGLLIGEPTAEDVKIKIGSAYEKKLKLKMQKTKEEESGKVAIIRGRDIETGLPRSIRIGEDEIREALSSVLSGIIEEIADVLEESPPELTSDILEHGLLLTGGGAKLAGLDTLIVERIHIPVIVADDPLTTVVRGAGKVLENPEFLKRVRVTGGLQ
jgi:rod shape-determining protein MreB